jgi:hypothetical protein
MRVNQQPNRRRRRSRLAATALGAALLAGCKAPPPPPPPAPPPVVWQPPMNRTARIAELSGRAANFHDLVDQLPAPTSDDHRRITAMALDELVKILRLAEGPHEPPGFDNTVGVVSSAEEAVGASALSLRRSQVAETEGIRAAFDALQQIHDTKLRDDDQLAGMLNGVQASLDSLQASTGAFHDSAADDALRVIDGIVMRVDADFRE